MDVALGLGAVAILILLNGFFVLGEFALLAVDRTRVEQEAESGRRGAISALRALRTLSLQLSGAQLGITLTSLILGFIAEPTIGRLIAPVVEAAGAPAASVRAISITAALALATAFQMVLAELIPKNYAIARPFTTAITVSGPLRAFNTLLKPLIVFLNESANLTVRLFGVEPREEILSVRSIEELQLVIHASREQGSLREEEFSLLTRSISFGEKTATDVLIPRVSVIAVAAEEPISALVDIAMDSGHTRFPVYGEDVDDIVGVVNVKDALRIPPEARSTTRLTEIMREPLVIPETADLKTLLREMRRERKHLAVLIDEFGGTAGIATFEDLLEEIVGEIEDEYDLAHAGVEVTGPPKGIHVVSGMLRPHDVRQETGFQMPDGDYDTLAGFLLSLFDRIPSPGEHISYDGWEFKVIEMDRNRIDKVLLVVPTGRSEEAAEESQA